MATDDVNAFLALGEQDGLAQQMNDAELNEYLMTRETPAVVSEDRPLTDAGGEMGALSDNWNGQSRALTMDSGYVENEVRSKRMAALQDVALARCGDAEAAKRAENDEWYWTVTPEAAADAENTDDVLGDALCRLYGSADARAVWDAMNASADYEYEQMPAWNTRAEGSRLVWGRFTKMMRGKKAAAEAAQAVVNERLKGLEDFTGGKDAKRDDAGKLADDAMTEGRMWEMVNQGVLEVRDVQRALKVREFMQRYVVPLGKRAEMDERMRGIDGLRDELFELIGDDKDTARLAYDALMRWAGEQRAKNDTGAGDEFQVAVGKKLSDWSRVAYEVAPLALVTAGAPGPVSPAFAERMAQEYAKRSDRQENARLASGMLRAAMDEAMKVPEGGFWQGVRNSPRVAAMMAGDTLPYLVPYVGGYLGAADAFVRAYSSGIDMKVLDYELGDNNGGWQNRKAMGTAALAEGGIQALVEIMPWSRVGNKSITSSIGRKIKAATAGKYVPGALSRAISRVTQKSLARAMVTEFASNVAVEGLVEPIAQGVLTMTAEGVMDRFGVEHGRSKSFSEAFAELGEIWSPEQLAGFLMFSAALTAPAYWEAKSNVKLYKANVKKFARNVEVWESQGLSRAEAEEAAGAEDPVERGRELVDDGWQKDPAGMHARLLQKHKELKESGRTIVFAGVNTGGFDADTVKLMGEAWRASQKRFHLPEVELLGDGRVRLTREEIPGVIDAVDLTLTAEQADAFLFQEIARLDAEMLKDWQKSGGNADEYQSVQGKLANLVDRAMGDVAVDAAAAEGSMDVEAMGKGLPEDLRALIQEAGGINLGVAKKISEWAIGQMEALEAGGMSRAEAREQVVSDDGGATLEVLAGMGSSMQKRLELAGNMSLRSALNRRRGVRRVQFNGRSVLGNVLVHARGGATGMNAVEDISESVFDMMVQSRTEAILENQAAARKAAGEAERPATLTEARDAEAQAWDELADVARKAREALLKVDPDMAIEEVDGSGLNTIEALSTMALGRYLNSAVLPAWMSGLVDLMKKNVQAAAAVVQMQKAMVALGEKDPSELKALLEFLDDAGVQVGKSLAGARVEAVADRIRELARWHAGADAAGPGGVGGMSVSQAQEEVLDEEDEIQQNDKAREEVVKSKPADAAVRENEEDVRAFENNTARGSVPERMRGVFVGDSAVYSVAGDYWCGKIEKGKLADGTEQVKVGEKGKHGVIVGKELTGRFIVDTAPILVWKRRDGSLQVISGRHRFAKLMEDESATSAMCYVYEETDERDEKWARMKDYEQNMCDDQADEVTCAVYARETGLTEDEMRERGLTRNGSRSKRGIFIGQHAREELWTRFRNGEIKPMDAELVCKLTSTLADQSNVAEIQAHCCGLLKAGKSWDYIGASVQLMASAEAQKAEQMLLDLGADFTANLERMARWVELCRKAFREAIDLLKDEKRRVKKGVKASRLGLGATMTDEKREEMLGDLEAMDAKFEMIGSYPELVAEAKLWDGDESKFADPVAMYLERVEAMQAESLQEEQDRKAAEEATPMFSWSLTPSRARAAWNGRVAGKDVQRVVDFNGAPVDLAVSSRLGEKGGDALRRVVAGDYRDELERWKQEALSVLQGMVSKKKWNDVEQHVRAGKATMDVVKRAIADGKIAPLPKQGMKVSDEELRALHSKRIVYFEKRKGEVLDLLEGVMGVRSVDESKLSSSVYFNTPYGKVRLSDHVEPMGTGHAVSTVLDLRYDMSDAEVLAAAEAYTAEVGGRGARIAKAFHQVEAQESVAVDVPGVYVESVSEAKNAIKDAYDKLKKNPVQMGDGSVVRFYAPGLNEVKQHAGDRRVFAAIAKMRELSEKAVHIDTALNMQKDIPSKKTIERYHYYLSKGNFPGYDKWAALRGKNAGASGDAYVMIVVAEEENGDKFYDLDATDVEDVEANKGASATLEATRFPKAGRQGHDAPKGRIHRVKEYVNHIDAQNSNFSASVTGGKNLAAVHTLSAEKFLAAVELGGMPMPSVAVTRLDRPYEWGSAGNINLIGKPEMVDPRKKSKVYLYDAYAGMMPPVMYRKKNTEGALKLKADALEKLAPYGMGASDGLMSGLFSNDYNESVVDGHYADLGNNRALMAYWAITQAGYAPKPKMKEAEGLLSSALYKALKPWVAKLPEMRMFSDDFTDDMLEGFRAAMVGYFEGKGKAMLADNYRKQDYSTLRLQAVDFAGKVRRNTTKKVPDAVENGKRFVAYAEKRHKAFKAWVDAERKKYLGEKVFSRKYVRRNRRGEVVDEWWGHEKYTLSNLIRYMREEKGRGEESASMSPGVFLAVMAEEFRSMRDMQASRDRIVDSESHKDAREEWQKAWDKFNKLAYGLKKPGWGGYFEIADAALWRLLELVSGGRNMPSREAVEKKLNESKDGWTDEHVDAAMELLSKAVAMPSDYMEAIPQRAVKMDEWEYAVLPVGLKKNKAVVAALREHGIKPIWHDGTEEGRRAALAGLVDNPVVSFSVIGRKARTWDKYVDRAFAGRDDGMWRAEIDASQAKLKKGALVGNAGAVYRKLVAGDDMPDKTRAALMQLREDKKVLDGWYAAMDKGEEYADAYMKKYLAGDWLDRYQERSSMVQAYVRNALLYAGVSGEGKYGSLAKGSRLVGTVFNSMLAGDVNEDLAKVLDSMSKKRYLPLGELLDYPELYDAYPELADVAVRYSGIETAYGRAIYGNGEPEIQINRNLEGEWEKIHSILLHEIQHHIQHIEGWAKGGNPAYARRFVDNRAATGDNQAMALRELSDIELYSRFAGEIESRNVQHRMDWSADKRAAIPFNSTLEYPGEALVTYSLTGAAAAGRRVLDESGDEYVANRLQEAWQKNLEKWSVLNAGKSDANSAMRAVLEMEGLVKATYDVVQDDVKLGRLYMLQRWAMVYARMVESGEIPPKGALKGPAYEKFVERLTAEQRTEMRRGMSREQAEELVKELGVTRLESAMEKVARECLRAAEWHLKQKETARVKRLLEAAWPKREEGKKSPRGKLAAREYRRLEWIAKVMELSAEDKYKETKRIIREINELPQELVGYEERKAELEAVIASLDPAAADYVERKVELEKEVRELNPNEVGYEEAKAELEDQLNWLHVFGGWADMDVSQARKAARTLEDLLLRGFTAWELKVQRERERTRRVANEISSHFKTPWYETTAERKKDSDKAGTNKAKMLKGLRWGLMGYAQMMLALRKKLGKVFCDRQRRTIAEAHRNLLTAQKDLQDWSAMELQKITGLTGAALEQWIAGNNQNVNTGIMLKKTRTEKISLDAKMVDKLELMSAAQREEWRVQELATAEADGRAIVLPTDAEVHEMAAYRLKHPGRKKIEIERTEAEDVELVATKEGMLYAVLLFEQPDYEHLVVEHGMTWADVDAMKKIIGPKLLRWGYAMRKYLNENGELLAAKYEDWNGTPFGRRANYFRGVFDVNKPKPETDIMDDNAGANPLGGSKYSILIPRRYHRQQINWQMGASHVFMLTMNEQNNYIHTQHITREWRQLLSRKWFADGLSAEIGTNAVNMIKLHLDVIDAAPRADAAMTSMFGRLVQGVMKATAVSSLALNVYSYIKQVSCLLNAVVGGYVPDAVVKQSGVYQVLTYSGIGAGELVKSYARVLAGKGALSFREMTGSAVIQSRIQSGGKRVAETLMLRTGQKLPNKVGRAGEVAGEWALEQMDMIDRKANTVAAMVVADAVYRKLSATDGGKDAGDKWVREQAIEAAGLMVDLVAQPKLRTQKGLWASHGGFFGGVGNFFYMFRSESLAKIGTYLAQISSGDYAKALGGFMSMGVGLWLVGLLCSFLKGQIDGDDLDDEKDLLQFARKSVTEIVFGDLASLPIIGGGIGAAKAAIGGTWHYVQDPLQMLLPVSDLWKRPKQLYKAVDNEGIWSFKAMRALCNCLRVGGNVSGWGLGTGSAASSSACGIILGAAVIGNAGRFALDVAERLSED